MRPPRPPRRAPLPVGSALWRREPATSGRALWPPARRTQNTGHAHLGSRAPPARARPWANDLCARAARRRHSCRKLRQPNQLAGLMMRPTCAPGASSRLPVAAAPTPAAHLSRPLSRQAYGLRRKCFAYATATKCHECSHNANRTMANASQPASDHRAAIKLLTCAHAPNP